MRDAARPAMNIVAWKICVELEATYIGLFARVVGNLDEPICRGSVGPKRRAPVGKRE
jgi:hypothetical protein